MTSQEAVKLAGEFVDVDFPKKEVSPFQGQDSEKVVTFATPRTTKKKEELRGTPSAPGSSAMSLFRLLGIGAARGSARCPHPRRWLCSSHWLGTGAKVFGFVRVESRQP
ncbi:hypothetical protein UY3_14814 [Chelonia mydas]|uniref:Uncharacterized protein n=1 Tax=Chelonia mydas TaxID=8469 RepID=M7B7M1_CHEMY|nr:hypothetical protein UY3_14814 [Chelonia mydas]